jgi:hypothetical protein
MMLPEITGLKFYPKTHQYILQQGSVNLQLPSVTQIIRFISSEFWAPAEEDTAGYIEAYNQWKNDYQPEIIATEWRGYHRTMFYAGTVDKLIRLPHQTKEGLVIVDVKTSSTYHPLLVDIQLGGYAQMIEAWPGMKIDSTWGLQLKPDGSYKFHRTQDLSRIKSYFMMCYALHNAVQQEKEA